eukprot:gene10077-biopygen4663
MGPSDVNGPARAGAGAGAADAARAGAADADAVGVRGVYRHAKRGVPGGGRAGEGEVRHFAGRVLCRLHA